MPETEPTWQPEVREMESTDYRAPPATDLAETPARPFKAPCDDACFDCMDEQEKDDTTHDPAADFRADLNRVREMLESGGCVGQTATKEGEAVLRLARRRWESLAEMGAILRLVVRMLDGEDVQSDLRVLAAAALFNVQIPPTGD